MAKQSNQTASGLTFRAVGSTDEPDGGNGGTDEPITAAPDGIATVNPDTRGSDNGNGDGNTDGSDVRRNKDGSIRKKRGRRSVTQTAQGSKVSVSGLEKILIGIHKGMATLASAPEFALSDTEAHDLAVGVQEVGKHYNLEVADKTLAWVNLIAIVFAIYGSRAMLLFGNRKPRQAKAPQQPATRPLAEVIPTRPVAPNGQPLPGTNDVQGEGSTQMGLHNLVPIPGSYEEE